MRTLVLASHQPAPDIQPQIHHQRNVEFRIPDEPGTEKTFTGCGLVRFGWAYLNAARCGQIDLRMHMAPCARLGKNSNVWVPIFYTGRRWIMMLMRLSTIFVRSVEGYVTYFSRYECLAMPIFNAEEVAVLKRSVSRSLLN